MSKLCAAKAQTVRRKVFLPPQTACWPLKVILGLVCLAWDSLLRKGAAKHFLSVARAEEGSAVGT